MLKGMVLHLTIISLVKKLKKNHFIKAYKRMKGGKINMKKLQKNIVDYINNIYPISVKREN